MIPVIICGGFGTKLWPVSRQHKPKTFIPLIGNKSLFRINYESLITRFKPEEIYVSTNQDQAVLAQAQAPEIPVANYIIEPEMRNTGPAMGLITATLIKKGLSNEPFMIIQADVLRDPAESFVKAMIDCDPIARRETKYITGGFRPNYPIMGVDYLMKGERVTSGSEIGIFNVSKFVWRGSKEQTEEFIRDENALVHANHTCITPKNLLDLFQKYSTDWFVPITNIINGAEVGVEYEKMPAGPFEDMTQKVFAAGESLVFELPFKWVDFGTFESLDKYLKENGLYKTTDNIVDLNGKDNFVRLDDPNKIIALVGVDNLVVVDTGDVLLICQKDQSGQVGEALKEVDKRKLALT